MEKWIKLMVYLSMRSNTI